MKYVREFEGLRGLMAIWVLLGHWASTVEAPFWLFKEKLLNYDAVVVFIMLSGFAITALLDKKPEPYGLYIQRRMLRIFPVYLLFLGVSILAAPLALETWANSPDGSMKAARIGIAADTLTYWPYQLAAHIPALHGLIPPRLLPSTDFAFLGQGWSISLEWQFYLIAPVLLTLLLNPWTRRKVGTAICATLVLVVLSHRMPMGFIGGTLHEFIIGMGSYYFMKGRAIPGSIASRIPILEAWLAIVLLCLFMSPVESIPYMLWASVLAGVIASRENSGKAGKALSDTLLSKPLQWIGKMAYSVYLSHMLVIVLGLNILEKLDIRDSLTQASLLLTFVLPVTLAVSWISYNFVELPFHNIGRRLGTTQVPATT